MAASAIASLPFIRVFAIIISSLILLDVDYHVGASACAGCAADALFRFYNLCRVIAFCVDFCLGKFNATLGASSCTETAALAQVLIDGYLYHFATSFLSLLFHYTKGRRKKQGKDKKRSLCLRIDKKKQV